MSFLTDREVRSAYPHPDLKVGKCLLASAKHLGKAPKPGLKKKALRRSRSVGLGFKTPREAIEGTYIDKKCPIIGNVSIRGRILTGLVQKMKMQQTIVIRRG
ncbi:30S ribosomal protein S11, chloroplastic [Homalodisca vitripennis]|nr:30S ribosomal protein S11, chloroplastic [Homalodisca vitripennis]